MCCTLSHEVPHHQKEQAATQDKVCIGTLWQEALELITAGIHLHPKAHCQHEKSNAAEEPRQEGVEGEGAHAEHVHELYCSSEQGIHHEGIDHLYPQWSLPIFCIKTLNDNICIGSKVLHAPLQRNHGVVVLSDVMVMMRTNVLFTARSNV
ncbi:hypothetical protein COCSUDRAFT_32672 [Coccomyxa subellipsoidea C-169]|uniref:Uncharacterized protein n=1 Tax=Coccomyxa subellipsoidea (strain C-169) TaxID=574566 RepID=I0Z4E7_COCSC|nr:hypothetical protein COCSUDRAFT_32672 [Coccomyxa subellipsoidea C-169]EIE25516.1 hypothetical protein COCSUDRAFT_32672 [Coccomyxa subellipsoidea C-169]|eukprot:XP_005650060.1 hypothetical protein COCSUDRAFT_32672 [Coccomyxa subellipsoidea C-169]